MAPVEHPAALLDDILDAAQTLADTPLHPQQATFVQHIHNTAQQLRHMVADVPRTAYALRQIIPTLGEAFTQPQPALYGYAKLLLAAPASFEGATLNDAQQALAERIYQQGMALAQRTDALQQAAFDERQAQRQAPATDFDLNMLVWQSVPVYRYWLRESHVSLTVDFPPGLPPIHGQPYHIAEIIRHLVVTLGRDLIDAGELRLSATHDRLQAQVALLLTCEDATLPPDALHILFEKDGRHVYRQRLHQQNATLHLPESPDAHVYVRVGWALASRLTS